MADKKELLLIEIREDGARVVKRKISDIGDTGNQVTNQMDKLKTVLAGLVSAKVLRDIILLADSYANMLNRLRVVTSGTWELHAAMDAVFQMSRETRTSLEANIDMYSRIAINTKQMGLEMEDVVRFATQLNHAIILSGVTAREAQWGMVQFSQGLAAGALRGDELRAVMEQLPIVTQTLTRYLGIGRGELRKWAFEGRVTTQVIIDAFNDAEKSLAERFGRRIPTVDQALTVLNNSVTDFIGGMDQAVQGTGSLAQAILWAADNMDTLARLALITATILGGILLKNLIGIVAQMKLFSLSILTVHPLVTALVLAGAALVVFSDKIKIAADSNATLADMFKALGEKAKLAYTVMRDGASEVAKDASLLKDDVRSVWQIMLDDVVWYVDGVIRLFQGTGEVIRWFFRDIPNHGKIAWNGLIDGLETIVDYFSAVTASIGDMFRVMALNIQTGWVNLAGSIDQLLAGNFKAAAKYGDQAALSFSKAASQGVNEFSSLLDKNLKLAVSEDSLAGAKFKIEKTGETVGEVFKLGFNKATLGFFEGLINRAKEIAAEGAGGPGKKGEKVFSPTPVQSQLLKDMLGDIGNVNNQMVQLQELWAAINSQQPGTEGMVVTLDQVNRKMNELKLKAMEVNTDVLSGFRRGFLQLGLEISNFADIAEKTIVNAFGSMEDAIVSLVTTGKVDFKGMVDSMLADLTRLITRMLFMKALEGLAGGGGMGASFAGLFGVGGGASATAGVAGSATPRALGGGVSPGTSYLVGERRPEIFTPAQPGYITPAQAAQAQAPAGDVVIINVGSEEEALAAMQSHEGKRVIRNEFRAYSQSGGRN